MTKGALETVVVSGLSGAGRSTAAKCLEDLGFFVVDNLPPELITTMVELGSRTQGAITRIAVVMDVRSRAFSSDLTAVIRDLAERGMRPRVLFLEARDDVLVRRFENIRRPHPLQGEGRLADGIAAERHLLAGLRGEATPATGRSTNCAASSSEPSRSAAIWKAGRTCAPLSSRSVTSTACPPTPTWWPMFASCPTRSGFLSCAL
jgi:RNase adaptor protein for sRNA GlmZ degradation